MLCVRCAEADGSKITRNPHASMEAAHFFQMLAEAGGDVAEHERWDPQAHTWVGEEVEGLVAPRRDRPDGVVRDAAGDVVRVWFYHGVHVHGYPPSHPKHSSWLKLLKCPAEEAYAKTMESMERFRAAGYEVRFVWSHEFVPFLRERNVRPVRELLSIVHWL